MLPHFYWTVYWQMAGCSLRHSDSHFRFFHSLIGGGFQFQYLLVQTINAWNIGQKNQYWRLFMGFTLWCHCDINSKWIHLWFPEKFIWVATQTLYLHWKNTMLYYRAQTRTDVLCKHSMSIYWFAWVGSDTHVPDKHYKCGGLPQLNQFSHRK